MKNETYNGWSNYATWRVNLELIDSEYYYEFIEAGQDDAYELSLIIKEDIENFFYDINEDNIILSYALAFVNDVNWYEIGSHIISEYKNN